MAPLSSPHRTHAAQALCEMLDQTAIIFPGSLLRIRFAVRPPPRNHRPRLPRLTDAPDGSYDLIFVDAFLGAAIPVHLLTREAMALYLRKLKPNGIVAMHVTNLNLELASVVAGIAEANAAITRVYDGGDVEEDARDGSKWPVV